MLAEKYISPFREHQYLQLLYVDSLTNVYNRRYYDECIKEAKNIEALAVIDINNFKQINDNFGYATGDSVLQSIMKTITSCVRKTDAVIRYGGDEFVIIFNSIPTDIFEKKPKIRHSINMLAVDEHTEIHVSVSIDGAYGMGKTKELFKAADSMMYQEKITKTR